jgi:hypothetical protein
MANVVMMQQKEDPLARYMQDYLAKRAQNREQEKLETKNTEMARINSIARQYQTLAPDQQAKVYNALPEEVRQFFMPPSSIPARELSSEERFKEMVTQDNMSQFPGLAPEAKRAGTYQSAYGAPQPKEITDTDIARQNLPPDQFEKSVRVTSGVDMKPHEQAAADLAESKFNTIEVPESGAKIKLTGAQVNATNASAENYRASAGKARAETSGITNPPPLPGAASGLTGEEFLKTLPPATAGLVRKIANYEMDLNAVSSIRGGKHGDSERMQLARIVAQYDPSFDGTQFPVRQASRKDFTSGKGAANIRSLNTAISHLDELDKAAKSLSNSSIPGWNAVANTVQRRGLGDPRVTNFENAANAVAGELATLFKGTGGTDQEIKHWRANLDPNMSPDQFKGSVATLLSLVGGRLSALEGQYGSAMNKPKGFTVLGPHAKAVLEKFGQEYKGAAPASGAQSGTDPLGLFQ